MQPPTLSKPSFTSMAVEWAKPRVSKLPVSGYKIKLTPVDGSGEPIGLPVVVIVNAARSARQVHNLDPGCGYVAQVAAMTIKGHGKFSPASEPLETRNEPPTIRGGLKVVDGPYKHSVVVEVQGGRPNGVHEWLLQVAEGRNGKWQAYRDTFAPDDRFEVTELKPNTLYRFRMQGGNDAGRGNWSEELTVTTTNKEAPDEEGSDDDFKPPKIVGAAVEEDSDDSDYIEGYDEEDDTDDDDMYSDDGFEDD